ncbi:MAG TPA: hypothetical protein VF598_10105, partial [Hymenobacter sp.]
MAGSAAETREAQKYTASEVENLKIAYATLAADVAKTVADQAAMREALVQGQTTLYERNAEALEELTRVKKSLVEAHQKADYQEKLVKDVRADNKERRVAYLQLQKQSDARILALEAQAKDMRNMIEELAAQKEDSSETPTATATPMFSLLAVRAEVEKLRVFKVEMVKRVVALEKRVEDELRGQETQSGPRKPENVREKTFTNIVDGLKAEIAEVRRAAEAPPTKKLDKGKGKELGATLNPKDNVAPQKPAVRILRRPVVPAVPVIPVKQTASAVDNDGFQLVTGRQRKETVVPKLYPTSQRALLVYFSAEVPNWKKPETATKALAIVNKTMRECPDVPSAPLLRARFSSDQSLVLTTGYESQGLQYEAYLNIIADCLKDFGKATARVCEPWSRFVLHNIPISMYMAEIREMVERHYPSMKMGQTPRWLIPVARRGKGTRSTAAVVITLVGNVTVETLGVEKLYLENRSCRIEEYLSYGPNTQCQRCQNYGHHTKRCAAPTAICAVCAEPHPTISHVCTVPRCRQGPMCVHPPLKCTNCHSPHRASDKNCPA